jgi:hypothetical protein
VLVFVRRRHVKKVAAGHALNAGIDVLARAAENAAARGVAKGGGFVLQQPLKALTRGEVLIAVADATSVALKVVDVTGKGVTEPLEDLARRIAEIDFLAGEMAPPQPRPALDPPPLTAEEESILGRGGLQPDRLRPDERRLLYRGTVEYADLLRDSYSVEQAARVLGVNGSRIRQRLTGTQRTLYGVKFAKAWRIPRFQFQKRHLVPGIEAVLARLPGNLHPVAVHRWFTSPNQDLTVADGRPVSPLEWLRSGNPPAPVADLAAAL